MNLFERAVAIAAEGHAGQRDKAGNPYLLHPLRVMMSVAGESARIVAVLHDIVEDTEWTLADLESEGFPKHILDGIDAVTNREGEDYFDFVRRAADDPIGRVVKRADLIDNLDISRIPNPSERDLLRFERYRKALAILDSLPD